MGNSDAGPPEGSDRLFGLTRNLALRILSTLVILPLAAGLLVLGGAYFTVFVAALAGCMAWEWTRIASERSDRAIAWIASLVSALVVVFSPWLEQDHLTFAILVAPALILGAALARRCPSPAWVAAAPLVACVACLSAVLLRGGEELSGSIPLIWLIASVAATDTGAYIAGRSIGGPRLAPRISPNKTWAGLVGGMVASAAVGGICGWLMKGADPTVLMILGAVIAVVGQIGDLLESSFKRRFNVKDSGRLIPGHGGVLDRLDGHMMVITVMAAVVLVSGQNPLIW